LCVGAGRCMARLDNAAGVTMPLYRELGRLGPGGEAEALRAGSNSFASRDSCLTWVKLKSFAYASLEQKVGRNCRPGVSQETLHGTLCRSVYEGCTW
jgi:hypothetical protein